MQKSNFYIFFFIGILFFSCSKEKFEAKIPSYISIPSISLSTDYATEGTASSNITDAWVFINDDLVGIYELPATFPVLNEGNVKIKVFGGIKENGVAANRKRYVLYDPHIVETTLIEKDTLEIDANITYNAGVQFTWMEDFENTNLSFLYTSGSDTVINQQADSIKEGKFSGHVYLTDEMNFFEATSPEFNTVSRNQEVYLELDFITNEPITLGVYLQNVTSAQAKVTLNPTDEWKKIYINLTDVIAKGASSASVKVFLGLKEGGFTVFSTSNPQIYIDNIKLVHY